MNKWLRVYVWMLFCAVASAQVEIPEGTHLRVQLEEDISSASAEQGQAVKLTLLEEIKIGGTVVIPQGAAVTGTVVEAVAKKLVRAGKLDISVDSVAAADGEQISLRYSTEEKNSSQALRDGIMKAGATMVLGPAAPLLAVMRAKDVTMSKGLVVDVYTDESHTLKVEQPKSIAESNSPGVDSEKNEVKPESELPVTLVDFAIASTPEGAIVTVDGMDVGDTPVSFQLKPGDYDLQIQKDGYTAWQRKVTAVADAPQKIEAALEKPAPAKPPAATSPKATAKKPGN